MSAQDANESQTQAPEPLLTYQQVADELHVKRGTLWFWVARGLIPYVRLGPRTVRFRREDLQRWLEQNAVKSRPSR